jgi:hypothetical protein
MRKILLALSMVAAMFSPAAQAVLPATQQVVSDFNMLYNPGFENGLAKWSSSGATPVLVSSGSNLLYGKSSITFQATGSGQYFQSELESVPNGLASGACVASIYAKNTDGNLKLQVVDNTGTVLTFFGNNAEQVLGSGYTGANRFSVGFNCPAAGTTIRLRVISTAASAAVAFDRAKLGDDDRFFRVNGKQSGWIDSGVLSLAVSTGGGSAPTKGTTSGNDHLYYKFNGPNVDYWVDYAQTTSGTTGTGQVIYNFPAAPACTIDTSKVRFETATTATGQATNFFGSISLGVPGTNGGTGGVVVYSSSQFRILAQQASSWAYQSDTLFAFNNSTLKIAGTFSIPCSNLMPASQDLYIQTAAPTDLSFVNEFSAQTTATGSAVSNLTYAGWVGTPSYASAVYTYTFGAGVFGQAPNCTAASGTGNVGCYVTTPATTTGVVVSCFNTNTQTASNGQHVLTCNRATTDYRIRSTILGALSSTPISSDSTGARTEWVRISNNGTTATKAAGTSCFGTPTRTGAGRVTVNLTAGCFSDIPSCTGILYSSASTSVGMVSIFGTATTTSIPIATRNSAGSDVDDNFMLTCIGSR